MHKLLLYTILSILLITPLSDLVVGQETGTPNYHPNPIMSSKHNTLTLYQLPQNYNIHMFDAQGRIILQKKLDIAVVERM